MTAASKETLTALADVLTRLDAAEAQVATHEKVHADLRAQVQSLHDQGLAVATQLQTAIRRLENLGD